MSTGPADLVEHCSRCGYVRASGPPPDSRCVVCGAAPGPGIPLPVLRLGGLGKMPLALGGTSLLALLLFTVVAMNLTGSKAGATPSSSVAGVTRGPGAVAATVQPSPASPVASNPASPAEPQVLAGLLDIAWAKGDWPEAIRLLETVKSRAPEALDWKEKLYVAHFNHGKALLQQGNRSAAVAEFRQANDLDPSRAEAAVELRALGAAPPSLANSISPVKIGDPVSTGGWAYVVKQVRREPSLVVNSSGDAATAKGVWLVVTVEVRNLGNRTSRFDGLNLEVQDEAGNAYELDRADSRSFSGHGKLASVGDDFPPGVASTMALLFDVNPKAKGFGLHLGQTDSFIELTQK